MSEILGSAELELTTDDSQFKSGIKGAHNVLTSFASTAAGIAEGISKSISGIAKTFSVIGLAAQGIQSTANAFKSVGNAIVGGNAQFEDYNVQFKTLIRNSADFKNKYAGITDAALLNAKANEEATAKMKALADFGARTPFDLPGVVDANRVLMGFGLQADNTAKRFGLSAEDIMTLTGDLASGTGQNFSEMATQLGKFSSGATGEAISRFQELGVVTRNELKDMGLNFSKSGELIVNSQEEMDHATSILMNAIKNKYGGLMQDQSNTFNGMMSNFRDWVAGVGRILSAPLFDPIKKSFASLMKLLGPTPFDKNVKDITKFGLAVLKVRDQIQKGVDTMISVFGKARQGIGFLLDGIDGNFKGIIATGGKFNTFMYNLGVTFRLARDSVLTFASALQGKWTDSSKIQDINRVFGNLGLAIRNIITTAEEMWTAFSKSSLAPIVGDFLKLYQAISPMSIALDVFVGFLKDGIPGAINALQQHFSGLTDSFGKLNGDIGKAIQNLAGPVLQWIGQQVPVLLNALGQWGQAFIDWIGPQIPGILAGLGQIASNVWQWITSNGKTLVENLANWGKAFIEWVGPMIPPFLAELGKIAAAALKWIGSQIGPFVEQLATWGKAFWDWVAPQIPKIIQEIGKIGAEVFKWIGEQAGPILEKLGEWGVSFIGWVATDVLPKIPGIIGDIANALFQWISAFAGAFGPKLGEWAKAFWEWMGVVLPKVPGMIGDFVGKVLEWIGASAGSLLPKFENEWAPAFWGWVKDVWPKVDAGLGSFMDSLSNWITDQGIFIHNNIGTWADQSVKAVAEWTIKVKDAVVNGIRDIAKWFLDTAVQMWDDWRHNWEENGGKIVDGLLDGIRRAWDNLTAGVREKVTGLINFVKGLFGIASPSTVFASIGEDIVNGILQGLQGAWEGVVSFFNDKIQGLKDIWKGFTSWFSGDNTVSGKMKDIVQAAQGMATGTNTSFGQVKNGAQNMATSMAGSIQTYISSVTKIGSATLGAVAEATNALRNSNAPAQAASLGASIVSGLANGILNNAQRVANAAASLVQGAINSARQTAQSASPSKVMINEGKNLADGVAVGIDKNKDAPINAIVGLFEGLNDKALEAASASGELVSKILDTAQKLIDTLSNLKGYTGPGADTLKSFGTDMGEFIKMYQGVAGQFNVKTLEGSAKFTEAASSIAGVVSSLADAMGKLVKWVGPGTDSMKGFAYDMVIMVKEFQAAAGQFDAKGLAAAELFGGVAAKIAEPISSMADAMAKIRDWSGIARESIAGFTGNIKDLLMDFGTNANFFSGTMLPDAEKFANSAQKVSGAVSGMADALSKVLNWSGLARESISGFVGNIKDMIFDFAEYSKQVDEKMVGDADKFADGSIKVSDAVSKGATALKGILDWVGIARDSISGFTGNLKDMVFDFSEAGIIFSKDMYARAEAFAETAGKVVDVIGKGVDGLAKLLEFKQVAYDTIHLFVENVRQAVQEFISQSGGLTPEMLGAASAFAETGGKVLDLIGKGVTALTGVNKYKGVIAEKLTQLITDTVSAVRAFSKQVEDVKPDATNAGAAFAEAAGKIFDGLNKAVTLFTSLQKYVTIPSTTIDAFINDVKLTVQKAVDMTEITNKELIAQIGLFGDAVGKLFDGLKKAMELFASLVNYKSTPSKTIGAFIEEIRTTIELAAQLATDTQTDLNDKALDFVNAVSEIFNGLKGALELFLKLKEYKDNPNDALMTILKEMVNVIDSAASLVDRSETILAKSKAFAQNMKEALENFIKGQSFGRDIQNQSPPNNPGEGSFLPMPANTPGMASGGTAPRAGMYKVGELGSEYVFLPEASRVLNAMQSRALDRNLKGGRTTVVNNQNTKNLYLNVQSTQPAPSIVQSFETMEVMA